MSSFDPSTSPPPPPPRNSRRLPPPTTAAEEAEHAWSVDRGVRKSATEVLSWCTGRYKILTDENPDVPYLVFGAIGVSVAISTLFLSLGLVPTLPANGKAVLVNLWGFAYPALATIREADTSKERAMKPSAAFSGYWVSAMYDGCEFVISACLDISTCTSRRIRFPDFPVPRHVYKREPHMTPLQGRATYEYYLPVIATAVLINTPYNSTRTAVSICTLVCTWTVFYVMRKH